MKEKILIINDDDNIREITQIILQTKGYETIEANNGKVGIDQAIQKKPDLILLDIIMPEMDGYEVCKQLKNSPITKEIPVLFFSSLTNPKDKIKALEIGGVDFVNNVVDQGELLARVEVHLHIRSLSRSLMESNKELTLKQKKIDEDLHAAAIIQKSFLPPLNLKIPNIELATVWIPANLVGGDIFNVIQKGQDKVIFYMIDVSGHDVPSALVTVSLSQYLHQKNDSMGPLSSPKQILEDLDNEYPFERFDRYFTIFYLILDIPTSTLSYSCAGHPSAILLSNNREIKSLGQGGKIIGLNKNQTFEEETEKLNPGDKILLYTDGLIEMKNNQNEFYGTERLYGVLENIKHKPVEEIVKTVQTSIEVFSQGIGIKDDISLMCFEFVKS